MSLTLNDGATAPRRFTLPRKRSLTFLLLIVLLCALAGYGWHWYHTGRYLQQTDDAYVGGDISVLSAKVPGYIARVWVLDNQQVQQGDRLITLESADYQAALAQAQANVSAQRAQLVDIAATRQLQQATIASAQASVRSAQAESRRTRDDNQRYSALVSSAAVSRQSREQAAAAWQQAVAAEQKAQAETTASQRQLAVLDARSQQAQAALEQALAQLDMARLNVGYTDIRAPFTGTVGNRRARPGAFAAAGTQLLSLVPSQGLWIDANFKESQLAEMKPGQKAEIRADVMPDRVFHGHVSSLSPATGAQFSVLPAENATGNFTKIVQRVPVRILLDSNDSRLGALRPGLSVTVNVNQQDR
jgi:membrane fusion protein (multidrug efflux system)